MQPAPPRQPPPVKVPDPVLHLPAWSNPPPQGTFYFEVVKDGQVIATIPFDARQHVFGRHTDCHTPLDHPSTSRFHAQVLHHRNGSIYVTDLGSAHGTFVAGGRAPPWEPVELDVGCKLRFAESTRVYVLRRAVPDSVVDARGGIAHRPSSPLPPRPDPDDEEAVLQFNTLCNKKGMYPEDVTRDGEQAGASQGGAVTLPTSPCAEQGVVGGGTSASSGVPNAGGEPQAGTCDPSAGDAVAGADGTTNADGAGTSMMPSGTLPSSSSSLAAAAAGITTTTGAAAATVAAATVKAAGQPGTAAAGANHKAAPKSILRKRRAAPSTLLAQAGGEVSSLSVAVSTDSLAGHDALREAGGVDGEAPQAKRFKPVAATAWRRRISFRDEMGGQLVEELGNNDAKGDDDGVIVGPIAVKAGEQTGKYANLMQTTVIIPAGKAIKSTASASAPLAGSALATQPAAPGVSKTGTRPASGPGTWGGASQGNTQAAFLTRVQTLLHPGANPYLMLPPLSVAAPACPPTPVGSAAMQGSLPKSTSSTSDQLKKG